MADIDGTNDNDDLIGDALGESADADDLQPDVDPRDLGDQVDPSTVEGGHVGGTSSRSGSRSRCSAPTSTTR